MQLLITWKDVITSLIVGLSSSTIFLFLLWNLKPNFKISGIICCEETDYNGKIKKVFLFKVINRSCFFPVYDVKAVAVVIRPIKNLNGTNDDISPLSIVFDSTSIVPKFNFKHYFQDFFRGESWLKQRTDYAIKFFTIMDCKKILNNNDKTIEIQIITKHALAGFSKVKTMRYDHVLKIEDGSFLSGNSFKIVNRNQRAIIRTS